MLKLVFTTYTAHERIGLQSDSRLCKVRRVRDNGDAIGLLPGNELLEAGPEPAHIRQ